MTRRNIERIFGFALVIIGVIVVLGAALAKSYDMAVLSGVSMILFIPVAIWYLSKSGGNGQ